MADGGGQPEPSASDERERDRTGAVLTGPHQLCYQITVANFLPLRETLSRRVTQWIMQIYTLRLSLLVYNVHYCTLIAATANDDDTAESAPASHDWENRASPPWSIAACKIGS